MGMSELGTFVSEDLPYIALSYNGLMSALGQKADIAARPRNVRFVLKKQTKCDAAKRSVFSRPLSTMPAIRASPDSI